MFSYVEAYFGVLNLVMSVFICLISLFMLICSVIVEALKVDSLQKLCSSLEPILRRVVRKFVHCGIDS